MTDETTPSAATLRGDADKFRREAQDAFSTAEALRQTGRDAFAPEYQAIADSRFRAAAALIALGKEQNNG